MRPALTRTRTINAFPAHALDALLAHVTEGIVARLLDGRVAGVGRSLILMNHVHNNVAHWIMNSDELMLEIVLGTTVQNAVRTHIIIRAVQTFESDTTNWGVANVTMCWVQWVSLNAVRVLSRNGRGAGNACNGRVGALKAGNVNTVIEPVTETMRGTLASEALVTLNR